MVIAEVVEKESIAEKGIEETRKRKVKRGKFGVDIFYMEISNLANRPYPQAIVCRLTVYNLISFTT